VTNGGASSGVRVAFSTSAGQADILVTSGAGTPPLAGAFDAASLKLVSEFFAFDALFLGGVFPGGQR
jgi:hypothetical protein